MTCDEAMETLLESDHCATHQALEMHLAGCTKCAEFAGRVVGVSVSMKLQYVSLTPRRDAAQMATLAIAKSGATQTRSGHRIKSLVVGAMSLAAAAVVAVVIIERRPTTPIAQPIVRVAADSSSIAVDVPDGRNAIVFSTRNPQISVVWIY
jgi:hypothetical protein